MESDDVHWPLCFRILILFQFFITYYRQRDLTLGGFFTNIRSSKIDYFLNFDLDLRFQDYLLQELDDQLQCNHFAEDLMKII